jgi:hypothetical protein
MQLHWGWAVLGALVLAGALVWWTQDSGPSGTDRVDDHGPGPHRGAAHADAGPTLYRWIDAHGVINVSTEKPPPGTRYTIVHINPNQNIVPMGKSGQ